MSILRVGPAIFGRDEAIAAVTAAARQSSTFFAALGDAELATIVYADGDCRWTARDVLAHLAGRGLGYVLVVEFARRGEPLDGIDPVEFAQARLEDRQDRSVGELLGELQLVNEHVVERLRTMPADLLHAPVRYRDCTWTLIDALACAEARHTLAHVAAVRRALFPGHTGF